MNYETKENFPKLLIITKLFLSTVLEEKTEFALLSIENIIKSLVEIEVITNYALRLCPQKVGKNSIGLYQEYLIKILYCFLDF